MHRLFKTNDKASEVLIKLGVDILDKEGNLRKISEVLEDLAVSEIEGEKNIPKKFIAVKRRDHFQFSWNECPTCGKSIGYHPSITDFRCKGCNQRILWK